MSITSFEFLEDRVRVFYHLEKPYGIQDVYDYKDVFYDSIERLPEVPETVGISGGSDEDITIPRLGRTITFKFDRYEEKSFGPLEEDIYGPYLR